MKFNFFLLSGLFKETSSVSLSLFLVLALLKLSRLEREASMRLSHCENSSCKLAKWNKMECAPEYFPIVPFGVLMMNGEHHAVSNSSPCSPKFRIRNLTMAKFKWIAPIWRLRCFLSSHTACVTQGSSYKSRLPIEKSGTASLQVTSSGDLCQRPELSQLLPEVAHYRKTSSEQKKNNFFEIC